MSHHEITTLPILKLRSIVSKHFISTANVELPIVPAFLLTFKTVSVKYFHALPSLSSTFLDFATQEFMLNCFLCCLLFSYSMPVISHPNLDSCYTNILLFVVGY